jgi:hypothetical protein
MMDDKRLGVLSPDRWLMSTQPIASPVRRSFTRKRGMPAFILSDPNAHGKGAGGTSERAQPWNSRLFLSGMRCWALN